MDNLPDQRPNMMLPPLSVENTPRSRSIEVMPPSQPEQLRNREMTTGQPSAPPPLPVIPVDDLTMTQSVGADDQSAQPADDLSISDESRDLISKEWIFRAKHIIEQTRNDPYEQSKEFNKLKAEYIKKRYNLSIKVNNE